jgi:hypothetical protein
VAPKPAAPAPKPVWGEWELHRWWDACEEEKLGRKAAEEGYLFLRRCFPRRNWKLVESGYLALGDDTLDVWPESDRERLRRLIAYRGWAFVAPLRSAANNRIENLYMRFVKKGDPKGLTLPGVPHVDCTGAPLGYGWAGASLRTPTLVLCEGMADTMLAEAMVREHADLCAVGAMDAGAMGKVWPQWLEGRARRESVTGGRVVVVYHLDRGKEPGALGPGPSAAMQLVRHLDRCGVRAELFDWPRYKRALGKLGDAVGTSVFDLADVMMAAGPHEFAALREAFLKVVQKD